MRHDTRAPRRRPCCARDRHTLARERTMERLELRRHAPRDGERDGLSERGRAMAEDVGRSRGIRYDAIFVSPAARAAETAAWILRGAGQPLPPDHAVIPGLAGQDASGGSPEGMAAGLRRLLDRVPEGGRGIAFSHTPLVERGAFGLTGREIVTLKELEGVLVTLEDDDVAVEELRLPP